MGAAFQAEGYCRPRLGSADCRERCSLPRTRAPGAPGCRHLHPRAPHSGGGGPLLEANAERHLKSAEEMARLFGATSKAIGQTTRFLKRCRFSLDDLKPHYPSEFRHGYETAHEALVALTEAGARSRYPKGLKEELRSTLNKELEVIKELDCAAYFLTVHDIVRFAESQGILCQGRGSAANSLVCYCLHITAVSPERAGLLFERFLSKERKGEPPDIDVDFEHERREEVIQHIYKHYKRRHAAMTATVISYRGRSAIRDVGKVFGLSKDVIDILAGSLWGWSMSGVTKEQALRAGLDASDPRLNQTLSLAHELLEFPRHLSQHVGGFVISEARLDEIVPIENAAMDDRTVIEWDKDDLDVLNILKVDVLGLGMLSCLRRGFDLIAQSLRRETQPFRHSRRRRARSLSNAVARGLHRRFPGGKPRADVDAAATEAGKIL